MHTLPAPDALLMGHYDFRLVAVSVLIAIMASIALSTVSRPRMGALDLPVVDPPARRSPDVALETLTTAALESRTPQVLPPVRRAKVLLAEDNAVNQHVAAGLLARRGHDVTVVQNGGQAVEAIQRETYDVVLMDVQMPEMGGLEATALIRRLCCDSARRVRIVALTAHAMSGDRERYLAAGMDDYLAKPFERLELFAAVEGHLPDTTARAAVASATAPA